jgi:metallo-beta-lactamase family protein
VQDIEKVISLVQDGARDYGKTYRYNEYLSYTLYANQHLFGASSVLVTLSYPGCDDLSVFFTGDYNCHNLFFEVPDLPDGLLSTSLTVVCEATYGDTDSSEVEKRFLSYLTEAIAAKKTIEYNVFAIGRSQDILFNLRQCQDAGILPLSIPIYLDGGLTVSNTFKIKENPELFGEKVTDFLPRNLTIVDRQFRPSIIANRDQKIIVTSSGMGGYGPSHQYLQHFLPQSDKLIVFTGFCVPGTLGADLMSVKKGDTFKLWGNDIVIQADVRYLEEFSAHAKRDELIAYLQRFKNLKSVIINHGEPETKEKFQFAVEKEVHPPKGTYILNRDRTIRITKFGADKSFGSKW